MKKVIPIFVILVGGLATLLYFKLEENNQAASRPSRGSGTIEGIEVDAVSRIPARVKAIHVAEGDRVEAGQLLVELDCEEPEAGLAQADASVNAAKAGVATAELGIGLARIGIETARRQHDAASEAARATGTQKGALAVKRGAAKRAAARLERLRSTGGGSEQDLDRIQSEAAAIGRQIRAVGASAEVARKQATVAEQGIAAAELRVRLAEAKRDATQQQMAVAEAARSRTRVAVGECRITAPRGGYVTFRNYEPGEVVMPGSRILTIVDIREVRATFYLPNAELAAAKPGRAVDVIADALPSEVFKGQIGRVGAEAEFTPRNVQTRDDRDRLVYAVEVAIANPDERLRPGMPVEIEIPGTGR